jgi:hypothetical protein
MAAAADLAHFVGAEPDRLTLDERRALTGKWIALESYSPATLPLRRIAAVADSPVACFAALRDQGLDPARFELTLMQPPY